jgi:Bacterial mobilisation protein (MobC)
MARPTKAPEEKRDDRLYPRLTTAERAVIENHAAILGLTPSDFMRRRSLGYRLPGTLAARRNLAAVAVALLRIGVNLNQVARHTNAGRDAPPDLCMLIARIDALLDDIYHAPGDNGGRAVL